MNEKESKFHVAYLELRDVLIRETDEATADFVFSTYASANDPDRFEKIVRGVLNDRQDLTVQFKEYSG